MTKADLLRLIRNKFVIALNQKTGWGKNEVLKIYDTCVMEVLYGSLDKEEEKD